jgi:protein-S-isoprenylcysteine O-methyltransferase Ste14
MPVRAYERTGIVELAPGFMGKRQGELVLWLGWALFYGSGAVFLGFCLWWVAFRFGIVPQEERALEARFGAAYRAYKARVPRWLGFPRR